MSCTPSRPFPPPRPPGYRPPPCPPPKPCRGGRESALLPKVAAWERCRLPCLSTELRLESLPCSAEGPCRLLMVQQSGAPPWWEPAEQPCGEQRLHIRVCIPVCCQVMDACERLYSASAVVKVDAALRLCCPPSECWRYQLLFIPYVRLLDTECSGECCVFHARLEVQLEWYQLRPEVCGMRRPEPPCPELPLYPPPIQVGGPCGCQPGWPRQR